MSTSGEHKNQPTRKRPLTEIDRPTEIMCTVVAIDHTNLCYRVCSVCERTLPENSAVCCRHCNFSNSFNPSSSGSKRLFRVLMSIATDTKVFVVIMFDRAARVLFGCSADEFFNFAKTHPFAATTACKALEGEMLTVTLSKPKNGNAQHLRVVSVVPMRTGFEPAIETLRELYRVRRVS
ncbi:replication factor-A carboxy-terminal domain protein [Perilla frutescens var. hirtella]|nr:replication factor-A carboxy-terminal domain protein [Perilla frutescens var. frutescens]KAH6791835.1 replication factor-A carboxy-terminal domain protein [Perilla frutescens var. hirtella]